MMVYSEELSKLFEEEKELTGKVKELTGKVKEVFKALGFEVEL